MRKPALLLFLLPTALFADEVFIQGAGSVSGRIVNQTATQVLVDIGGGTIGIPLAKVDHIVKAPTDLDVFDARAARLGPWDLEGWRALGRWASSLGMDAQARQAYTRILAVDPDDAEAEGALGFVFLEDRWVPEAIAYRARGFVKFEGEWMLPAEVQLRLDAAKQEQESRDAEASARAAEIEKLKEDLKAQYDAEAAADAEWRAEGAAWFYSHAYGYTGYYYDAVPIDALAVPPYGIPVPAAPHVHGSWGGRSWHGR